MYATGNLVYIPMIRITYFNPALKTKYAEKLICKYLYIEWEKIKWTQSNNETN